MDSLGVATAGFPESVRALQTPDFSPEEKMKIKNNKLRIKIRVRGKWKKGWLVWNVISWSLRLRQLFFRPSNESVSQIPVRRADRDFLIITFSENSE